jgi:putative oxygen-independent coproporphyrinogen III oxidase
VLTAPPLSLYVHLPWCVRKCPYCDFNSHSVRGEIPFGRYVRALLRDLEQDLPLVWGRTVSSVFLGGGTPSLFDPGYYEELLSGIRGLVSLAPDAEITMEANPGTTEHGRFGEYRAAGINRISLGAQTFDDGLLGAIGRIHGRREIDQAVESLHRAGLKNFNLDLMFALPGQSVDQAVEDVRCAIACEPVHISHYQLTLEPNTAFYASPPRLPGEELAWRMQDQSGLLLADAGFEQYEISAWALPGKQCRHNLNYWRYGDFLGIGAGAHGKITLPAPAEVRRRIRLRGPVAWMDAVEAGGGLAEDRLLEPPERLFEFFLNQLRLKSGVRRADFSGRTGLPWSEAEKGLEKALSRGLLIENDGLFCPTELGWRFVNDTQALFLP